MKKIYISIVLVLTIVFSFSACQSSMTSSTTESAEETEDEQQNRNVYITLGDEVQVSDYGVTVVDNSKLIIASVATYHISGTLNNGQIIVNTDEKGTVKLILNGVDITCSNSAPIYITNAEKTVINLADGTENIITDGENYTFKDAQTDEPDAAIFSKDDLTINGSGSLTVNANYNNGIQSKDDLKITGGIITVNAVNDGIKGKDSITYKNAEITINAGADGMQSNNDTDEEKGYITIESGSINIIAENDGIQAETYLAIVDGEINIKSGGGSANASPRNNMDSFGGPPMGMDRSTGTNTTQADTSNASTDIGSSKGLKAGTDIIISGGDLNIDSCDDAINSNNNIVIDGGNIILASGDDGVRSVTELEINGGEINITKSYEGIESSGITINNGTIHLVSSDDGVNATSGGGEFAMGGPMGGQMGRPTGGQTDGTNNAFNTLQDQNAMNQTGNDYLIINGGYLAVNAGGDGLDVNGPITMSGGVVLVNGPTNNGNGPLDYTGSFKITGGYMVAAGSSGMAMAPSTSSTIYSVMYNFSSVQAANTIVHIETNDGEEILTFSPLKQFQSILLCSSELRNNETYNIYSGGSSSGEIVDCLYTGGQYTAGNQIESFTISSMVTKIGTTGGGFAGGAGGGFAGGPGGGIPQR